MTIPHPAAFALHKLLVVLRRKTAEKRQKDLDSAVQVLELLEKKGEMHMAHRLLAQCPHAWRKSILATLRTEHHASVAKLLDRSRL